MNPPFLKNIVDLIVSEVAPDKIILFGSYARGDYNEKSDVDLLVMKKNLTNGFEVMDIIERAFYKNKIGIAVDVIPIDYDKYYEISDDIGYIYNTVKKEGKLVYDTH